MFGVATRVLRASRLAQDTVHDCVAAALRRPVEARTPPRLLILDTVFPDLLYAVQFAEFHSYLRQFAHSQVLTIGGGVKNPATAIQRHDRLYPELAGRVVKFNPRLRVSASLFYCIFLHNMDWFLPYVERHEAGVVFSLYPGGEFALDQRDSDDRLKRLFGSRKLRQVIVTQHVTHDYLLSRGLCHASEMTFIWGGVFPPQETTNLRLPEIGYGCGKDTLDICFVAHKYMDGGRDKGFDRFLDASRHIARANSAARFHVVGGFRPTDGDVTGLDGRIAFHGPMRHLDLARFLKGMDLVLSPNVPFVLGPGKFDGFPTGACTFAGLAGAAVFACDQLRENRYFKDGEEIVIIPRAPAAIAEMVLARVADPAKLIALRQNGQRAFSHRYSYATQLAPRISLLEQYAGGGA